MKLFYLFFIMFFLLGNLELSGQSTEVFEDETTGSASFTDLGETFNITSAEGYDVLFFASGGWNGSAPDNRFIDNSGGTSNGTGTGFTITMNSGNDFLVIDLFLFCSRSNLTNHTGTLTITGRKDNSDVYSIIKSSGFSNTESFSPNNGFTYIDFATEGAGNFTDDPIDELVFSSVGNLDYMALDAFQWNSAPLPIELTSFVGEKLENTIELLWETELEINNHKFEIERSQDARIFDKIGELPGNGTSFIVNKYSFTDEQPMLATNYYRLKQIDSDGKYEYSKVISVNFEKIQGQVGEFYPNPSISGQVNLLYENQDIEAINIAVFDMSGKLVLIQQQQVSNNNNLRFDFSSLNPGLYTVELQFNSNAVSRKLLIK